MRAWVTVLSLLPGCIYISDAELDAFYDRDGDGLDYKIDCDDANAKIGEGAQWWPDLDEDGFGDRDADGIGACEQPSGHVANADDCDDGNEGIQPLALEACDALDLDEDCNGAADDADNAATGKSEWFPDDDGDQFGDMGAPAVSACDAPAQHVADATDCDDDDGLVNPDAEELCDPANVDEDCDDLADDDDAGAIGGQDWYADLDGDGFGEEGGAPLTQCDAPASTSLDASDCDDAVFAINPAGVEVCDPLDADEDCDGAVDDADPGVAGQLDWFEDTDDDGFGDEAGTALSSCEAPAGRVLDATDCDDALATVNPSETEVCDDLDLDEDCNGAVEDGDGGLDLSTRETWYSDGDGDGFGDEGAAGFVACDGGAGDVTDNTDCDDTKFLVNPGVIDSPNDGDNDCDGVDYVCGETLVKVPGHYSTIQAAIDAVTNTGVPNLCDGDVIEVLPGTYNETLEIIGVSPVIRSAVGSVATILDANGAGRVVSLENSDASLIGFTLREGNAASEAQNEGGGLRVAFGDDNVFRDLVVTGNTAANGGGIEIQNSSDVTVQDCVISGNTATSNGGGVRIFGVATSASGQLAILDSDLVDNVAGNQDGAIRIDLDANTPAGVALSGLWIEGNSAVDTGGLGARTVPNLIVADTTFLANDGSAKIGGAFTRETTSYWENVVFEANTTGGTLAALQAESFTTGGIELVDVDFVDNAVTGNGYAVLLRGNETVGATLRRVTVAGTVGHDGASIFGGGLTAEGTLDARNVLVYDNTGFYGMQVLQESGVPIPASPATHLVENATFVGNEGDGLLVSATLATSITVRNVISAHNGGYGVGNANVPPVITYSDVFGNTEGAYSGVPPVGNGNQLVDPDFVSFSAGASSSTWDLQLAVGSPLIDAGDPALDDPDGTVSDPGYFGGPEAP